MAQNVDGVIVTVPHKTAIVDLCDSVSEAARLVGAVNVVTRSSDGKLHGEILDGEGFPVEPMGVVEGAGPRSGGNPGTQPGRRCESIEIAVVRGAIAAIEQPPQRGGMDERRRGQCC